MPEAAVPVLETPLVAPRSGAQSLGGGAEEIIEVIRRRLWVLLGVAGLVFALVALFTLTQPKRYTAASQLLINVAERQVVEDVRGLTPNAPLGEAAIETQKQVLMNRALAGRVVDALGLAQDPEFNPFAPKAADGADAKREPSSLERDFAITALLGSIRVDRIPQTLLIEVAATSLDPEKAARIADVYVEQYLADQVENKYAAVATAGEFVEQRLAILREDLIAKERAVEAFKASNNLLTADGSVLAEQSIAQLNVELSSARAALAQREARLRSFRANLAQGGDGGSAPEALGSATITNLRAQQAELARRRAELRERYLERHPRLLAIERESADLDLRINEELQRIASSLQDEVEAARLRVNSIERSLNEQRGALGRVNVGSVELNELQREAEASRNLYEAFLSRSRELAERAGVENADATIVVRATPPLTPSSPRTKLMLALGLIAGLAIGAAVVWLLELTERTVRRAEDVEQQLGLPALGALPALTRAERTMDSEIVAPADYVLRRAVSPYSEALRSLRAAVFFADGERAVKVLAVTSAMPQEGKTTTSIGLARLSAISGSRTVMVDCDLRRRSSSSALGIETDIGLIEHLEGNASLDAVIHKDPLCDLDVIPLAAVDFRPTDLLGSKQMHALIAALRERYDIVVLDTAPILPIADTRVLCSFADAVMINVQWGKTPVARVRDAIELVRHHEGRIVGAAIHGVGTGMMSRLLYDSRDYYVDLYDTYYAR